MSAEDNPYQPPRTPADVVSIAGWRFGLKGWSLEILVRRRRLKVWFSSWTGLEVYSIDGKEVLRLRSFNWFRARTLLLPDGSALQMRVTPFPVWRLRVTVDNRVVADDLAPLLKWWQLGSLLCLALGAVVTLVPDRVLIPLLLRLFASG